MKQHTTTRLSRTMLLLAATCCSLASGQFVPQSHLGRLVQSITSPLMLASSGGDSPDAYSPDPSGYYGGGGGGGGDSGEADEPQRVPGAREAGQQAQMLQQAPSHHRAIPQRYYSSSGAEGPERDHGPESSNQKQAQEYQMGADLGPTLDDKELSGVFNSNDERDDDDAPGASAGGYDELAMGRGGGGGGGRAAASQQYPREGDGYGPAAGRAPGAYDEDSADEDDEGGARPAQGRRGGRARSHGGLSQAASQYRQQGGPHGPLMAAANGYAPYGYANGPVDLTGLMSGLGGEQAAGYQAYNGDGSYPGAAYYQQQQQQGGGRPARGQAESAANGYYQNQAEAAPRQQQQQQRGQRQNDNDDNEADED